MKKTILIFFVITTLVLGCKKTNYSYMKLLGNYKLSEYTVDGVDSLDMYQDSLGLDYYFYYDDMRGNFNCEISGTRNDGNETMLYWRWMPNDKNDGIFVFGSYSQIINTGIGPFSKGKISVWVFSDVTDSEINMKTTFKDKEYIVDLKRF
jgi:hypothetical protein